MVAAERNPSRRSVGESGGVLFEFGAELSKAEPYSAFHGPIGKAEASSDLGVREAAVERECDHGFLSFGEAGE